MSLYFSYWFAISWILPGTSCLQRAQLIDQGLDGIAQHWVIYSWSNCQKWLFIDYTVTNSLSTGHCKWAVALCFIFSLTFFILNSHSCFRLTSPHPVYQRARLSTGPFGLCINWVQWLIYQVSTGPKGQLIDCWWQYGLTSGVFYKLIINQSLCTTPS